MNEEQGGEVIDFIVAKDAKLAEEAEREISEPTNDILIRYIYEEYFLENATLRERLSAYLMTLDEGLVAQVYMILRPRTSLREMLASANKEFDEEVDSENDWLSVVSDWMINEVGKSKSEIILRYKKDMLSNIKRVKKIVEKKREGDADIINIDSRRKK